MRIGSAASARPVAMVSASDRATWTPRKRLRMSRLLNFAAPGATLVVPAGEPSVQRESAIRTLG